MSFLAYDLLILLLLLFIGVPLPYCFAGAVLFLATTNGINLMSLVTWGVSQMTSFTLIAGPVFILVGLMLNTTKITDKLLDLASTFTTKVKGGLGVITVVVCGFLGAISGSSFTGVSACAPALQPKMVKAGYPAGYSAALLASSTILGILIPPSVTMITYGWITGTSVLACFLSTIVPAIVLMILLSIINIIDFKKFSANASPSTDTLSAAAAAAVVVPEAKRSRGGVFFSAIPALAMPIIILGGIYGGIFTPTEAAAVAVSVAVVVGVFCYRTLHPKNFLKTFRDSCSSIGAIMFMIFFCLLLSQIMVLLKIPESLVAVFMGFTTNKIVILLFLNVFLLFVGMIVNDSTAIVLCAPILLPLCQSYGISGVQLGAIMAVNLGFGGLTPPYASVLYLSMRVCDVKFEEIMKPTLRFLLCAYFPVSLLTTYISGFATWLPKLFGFM